MTCVTKYGLTITQWEQAPVTSIRVNYFNVLLVI